MDSKISYDATHALSRPVRSLRRLRTLLTVERSPRVDKTSDRQWFVAISMGVPTSLIQILAIETSTVEMRFLPS